MRRDNEESASFVTQVLRALGLKAVLAWVLLSVVAFSITSGVVDAVPDLEMVFVGLLSLLGVTLGWLLALLPVRAWFAALLSLVLGVEYLLVRVGSLGEGLAQITRTGWRALGETIVWYWTEQPPSWNAVWSLCLDLWADMGILISRTFRWLADVAAGGGVYDIVGATLAWGMVVWIYSVWAGWVSRRFSRPLLGVLLGGVLLGFVISYTGSSPYILLPVMGLTFVLMAIMHQTDRETRWRKRGVDFSQGLWSDVLLLASGIAIALVIASAIIPSITVDRIRAWVEEITARPTPAPDRPVSVAERLGLEPKPEPREIRPVESMITTGLPQRHLIGSGPELSRMVVMVVETGELPPLADNPSLIQEFPRHYWRSITYDYYFSRGWTTSPTDVIEYEAGEPINTSEAAHLRKLRQSVKLIGTQVGDIIHVDGSLVSVDQDFTVVWRVPEEVFAATTDSEEYRADSLYPVVTVKELQAASTVYPDWILTRYLQLPDSVPSRVTELAIRLTATEPTPYDRAVAIESYLRENYEYTLDVPTPGPQDDIADYFLFELQEGYCDYYATSMVVLARAAGLPARLVIGYLNGDYDPVLARYVVTEAHAHAWPEIYFPHYGWIEFEPTAGRPAIRRSSESEAPIWPEVVPSEPLVAPQLTLLPHVVIGIWVLAIVGGGLAVIGLVTGLDSLRLYFSTPRRLVVRLQRRLRRQARLFGLHLHRGDTPHEVAALLGQRIGSIAEAHGFTGDELVGPAVDEIETLSEMYVRIWYTPEHELSRRERWQAAWLWWRLRWRLALARLWRRLGRRRAARDKADAGSG